MKGPRFLSRRLLLLAVVLLLYWVLLATVLRENLGSSARLFNDYADRADYFLRGAWLPEHAVPYRDVPSEYPQVPTYLFGALYLPFLGQIPASSIFLRYSILFSFLMISLYIGMAFLLESMLPPDRRVMVLAFLLPAPLYFSYNRFDVLPALMMLLALKMAGQNKWEPAAVLLGIGTMTKWFPGLLVVPLVAYMRHTKQSLQRIGLVLGIFVFTCVAILLPTYLGGGLAAVVSPYVRYETQRGVDPAALPALLEPLLQSLFSLNMDATGRAVFFLLQLSILPVAAIAGPDSYKRLVCWSLMVLTVFMLFSRLYSPQWLLWILPLMLIVAGDAWDNAVIVAYATLSYLEFPILYVAFGTRPYALALAGWMNVVLLLWIGTRTIRRLRSPASEPAPAAT